MLICLAAAHKCNVLQYAVHSLFNLLAEHSSAFRVLLQECHKCKVLKPAGDFYRNRTNNDGLYNNCKLCFSENSQRRQQTLPPMEQRMADSKVLKDYP